MTTKAEIIHLLATNDKALARAIVVLNMRQTQDEQQVEVTKHHNRLGFRPCHAKKGTGMAKWFEEKGFLTQRQMAWWRQVTPTGKMRIEIYASQLLDAAQKKAAGMEPVRA